MEKRSKFRCRKQWVKKKHALFENRHKQLLNAKMSIKTSSTEESPMSKAMKKSFLCVVDMMMMKMKATKVKIPISNNDWCFCSMVAFVVKLFFYFMFLSSRVSEQKKTLFLRELYDEQSRAREKSRKCSIFTSSDDGMYHLKVINLKISRERRQENRRKRKKKSRNLHIVHLNSNKSRAFRSPVERKKYRNWNKL